MWELIQSNILEIVVTFLTAFATYIATRFKKKYEEHINTLEKQKIVKTVVNAIEQLYKDLDGPTRKEKAKENIYVIPFHSIGEEDGIMYGIRMDEMVVLVDDEPKFLYNPIIGIYTGNVSKRGNYSVILNRETFDGINDNKC